MRCLKQIVVAVYGLSLSLSLHATGLLEVCQAALQHNPSLLQAEATIKQAAATRMTGRADLLPQLSASGSINKDSSSSAGISLQQTIFNVPDVYAVNSDSLLLIMQRWALKQSKNELIYNTSVNYFKVAQDQQAIALQRVTVDLNNSLYKLSHAMYVAGRHTTIADVETAKTTYLQAQVTLLQDEITFKNDLAVLQQNTMLPIKDVATLNHRLKTIKQPPTLRRLQQEAYRFNPAVMGARMDIKASRYAILSAKAAHLPTLSASLSATHYFYSNAMLNSHNVSSVGLSAGLPIFNGGSMIAAQRTEEANLKYNQATLDIELQLLRTSLQSEHFSMLSTAQAIALQQATWLSAISAYHDTLTTYKAGRADILLVINTIENQQGARLSFYQSQYDYLTALLQVKRDSIGLNMGDVLAINKWIS